VEESAAAAESLKGQAQALVQTVAVFRLDSGTRSKDVAAEVSAPVAARGQVERRGPDRAKNVTRPKFGGKAQAGNVASPADAAPQKTGTDDEWTNF